MFINNNSVDSERSEGNVVSERWLVKEKRKLDGFGTGSCWSVVRPSKSNLPVLPCCPMFPLVLAYTNVLRDVVARLGSS